MIVERNHSTAERRPSAIPRFHALYREGRHSRGQTLDPDAEDTLLARAAMDDIGQGYVPVSDMSAAVGDIPAGGSSDFGPNNDFA